LLNAAITRSLGGGRRVPQIPKAFRPFEDQQLSSQLKNQMYLEKIPEGFNLIK